ncbi:MAG: FAD-dependent oxidoreductase [Pseudomonadota bacterium]|nr:FAD-dependent oxidoreductase [Pseudomonadota bacterium]
MNKKQIVIIGGGLQGLATANALVERGEEVLLLERESDVATSTSFANAGMMTPSQSSPWNSPSDIAQILAGIGKVDSPMLMKVNQIPSVFFWGLKFLRNSTPKRFNEISRNLFELANYSKNLTVQFRKRNNVTYDESEKGTLKIYRNTESMNKSISQHEKIFSNLDAVKIINKEELIELEPQLKEIQTELSGGLLFSNDEVGDAYKFCKILEERIRNNGGRILTNTNINKILINKGHVKGIVTERAILEAERVVICSGSWSRELLKKVGLNLPVRPVKGYSLTFDTTGLNNVPNISLVDESIHTAVTSFQNRIRVAGTAEFAGYDDAIHPKRIDYLYRMLENIYPSLYSQLEEGQGKIWHGFRPMSADGLPFIGTTKIKGLFVNCGQGHLGWTLAMGSAALLADQLQFKDSEIDRNPYLASRSL